MIFKIIGCVSIVCATTALGLGKAGELKRRVEELEAFSDAAGQLATEIRFAQTPLCEALGRLRNVPNCAVGSFFGTVADGLEDSGNTVADVWETVLRERVPSMALNREDVETLCAFGVCLGGSDVEGQLKSIAGLQEKLERRMNDAVEQRSKNQKLFTNLGVYAGLLICILLF